MNNLKKMIGGGIAAFVLLIIALMTIGINDGGYRTVIQKPSGDVSVKFTEGMYFTGFGKTTEYPNYITFDFDKNVNEESATHDQKGIALRYQDGGTGAIYGVAQFELPKDEASMIALHRKYRTPEGVAHKLIRNVTESTSNSTAGLLTSEEAYAEKRNTFTQWTRDQLANGKFLTKTKEIRTTDEATGKTVYKNVPDIAVDEKTGKILYTEDTLSRNGIIISSLEITDWDFEKRTLQQISDKRDATMKIITAKANAERAKQDAITAEAQGKADVMKARYEKEVTKQEAIVDAEQKKEVAVIGAEQFVAVAEQNKLVAEQKKLAAQEYKEEQILLGEGDAAYKKLVLEADGALEQKLKAYTEVSALYADAIGKQKWVADVQFNGAGGKAGESTNSATTLVDLLTVKTAKELSLDMKIDK